MLGLRKTIALAGVLGMLIGLISAGAHAATSADATIFNKATLTYSGGTATVGVSVKVALVGATPTLSLPADTSVISGDVIEVLYTLISNANGLDNYNLGSSQLNTANLQNATISFLQGDTGTTTITDIDLGAAITAATNDTANQILIPAGAEVNLAAGMYINLVGFGVYKIDTITPGSLPTVGADEVSTELNLITTSGPADALITGADFAIGAVAGGIQLGELKQFRVEVQGGAFTGATTTGTHTVTTIADPDAGTAANATDDVDIAVTAATVFLTKEVALVTGADGAGNGGTVGTYTTTSFDVSPGDVLSYRITMGPTVSQPAITSASVDDAVPAFTTYVTDSLTLNGVQVSTVLGSDAGTLPLTGGFQVNSVNSGANSGSGNDGTGDLGVIDAGSSAQLIFRVKIN